MGGDARQPVMTLDPAQAGGSGPAAVKRDARERVHEMAPALAPVDEHKPQGPCESGEVLAA